MVQVIVLGVLYSEKPPDEGTAETAFLKKPHSGSTTVPTMGCSPYAQDYRSQQCPRLEQSRGQTTICKSELLAAARGQNWDRQNTILNFKKLLKHTNQSIKREK